MLERFTEKARSVVFSAREKATEHGDSQIRPVHMLYGLTAADGPLGRIGRIPFNDQSRLTLALSLKEARALKHNYIGTEHVLLGLLRVAERNPRGEFAAKTLPGLGIDPGQTRQQVLDELRDAQA